MELTNPDAGQPVGADTGPTDNWSWKRAIPVWDWHTLSLHGWPGWERDADGLPAWSSRPFVAGSGTSARQVASVFDDLATGPFYWRVFTEDTLPAAAGESYNGCFWFSRRSDRDLFERTFPATVATGESS